MAKDGNLTDGTMWARQSIDINSRSIVAQSTYANLLARADRIDEAVAAVEAIREFLPGYKIRKSITAYNRLFGTEEARNAMTEGLQKLVDLGYE